MKTFVLACLLILALMLSGCDLITPKGEPKIELKSVIPVAPGTTIQITQPLEVNLSDSKRLQEVLANNLEVKEVPELSQFFGRVKFLPKESNIALRNGQVCVNFNEDHLEYLVIYMDGIEQVGETDCFSLPEVLLYNPEGWNFDMVGKAKTIHGYNSASAPFTIEITAESYYETADFAINIFKDEAS